MKSEIKPGLSRTQTYETTAQMRATQLTVDMFSTPAMIGLMEGTCVRLTAPYLDEGENTVGMHVDVYHLAPTKIGQSVTVTVEILEIDGNKIRYAVAAVNDAGVKIGEGKHRRAVMQTKKFADG
ncbi:MAG: thioesterase family protein [Candidatus Binatia bacterium]